ncbi:MAG: asparagine synthase (glutamine-hydrolyzing) [candidate division Zixibacteria bacterium 4484_95]|nr:MAG: asparagine synthase (glutamine-hydrolyzing) [candidate division Zixibacteria bacterium 4484_95]
MCGIAGYFNMGFESQAQTDLIRRMVTILKHRGPDEFGAYFDKRCGLGQARLSIIDLVGGSQPIHNEDETIWITYNGEIFNYIELAEELKKIGHKFYTNSDTEVIVHAYEQWGDDCFSRFNGQFAFALWDGKQLTLARDRVGICPLFYTVRNNRLYFGSEIKSIFCEDSINREIDLKGLDEIFTWWTTAYPRTFFKGISELPPGHYLIASDNGIKIKPFWRMNFPDSFDDKPAEYWAEALKEELIKASRLRLRADVPVGAYLSGGIDSSTTTILIRSFSSAPLQTFSVAFADEAFDESTYQNQMIKHLGTQHHQTKCTYNDIVENFPRVLWHTEKPILRTAPTPLMLLSGLVHDNNFKVVLTGEGADEILGGYDIFKETIIRAFWAKYPDSTWRPSLLRKLYPTLPLSGARAKLYLETFYKIGLNKQDRFFYSHIPRINTTSKIKEFYTREIQETLEGYDSVGSFSKHIPINFFDWPTLCRAQYLESASLLTGYLLSSQGDRMAMANSVETRFPFLDTNVMDMAAKIPPKYKIRGLVEKFVLKKAMKNLLPERILNRVKQPYMAPDAKSFYQKDTPEYVNEMLSERMLERYGLFNVKAVAKLESKCRRYADSYLGFKDNMALVGILSTQIVCHTFLDDFAKVKPADRAKFAIWIDRS